MNEFIFEFNGGVFCDACTYIHTFHVCMYTCVCMDTYKYTDIHIDVSMHIYFFNMCLCTNYAPIYTHMPIFLPTYLYVCMYVYMYIHTCFCYVCNVCMYINVCIHPYIYVCIYIYIYNIYIYIYIYIYIHTYIHTYIHM